MPGAYAVRHIAHTVPLYRIAETTYLFQRMCAELLPSTPYGQHLRDLGFTHMNELASLLWYDQTMATQTWRVIDLYSPAVEALLEGKGSRVRVSQKMVNELLYFLSEMEKRASPELGEIIREERARVPWKELVGLTVEEARAKLAGLLGDEPENSDPQVPIGP